MIFSKHINRYYRRFFLWLLGGLAALVVVDYLQLEIPELYQLVINGINKFCSKFGDERLLFGSNFPMDYFGGPIAALMSSDLPPESLEKIASGNLERLISEVRL